MRKVPLKLPKTPSYFSLVKKLDRIYSKFIRKSNADKNGMVRCATCGKCILWQESDCGHFINRKHMSTRFDHRNTAPQCRSCNRFDEGAKAEHAMYIEKTYGRKVLEELSRKKHMVQKWSTFDLSMLIKEYEDKFKLL